MGAIFGFILLIGAYWLLAKLPALLKAAGRAATGKGSLGDNLQVALRGMENFQVRLNDFPIDGGQAILAKEIQVKGLLPFNRAVRLGFITSIFDNTSGTFEPVISGLSEFQEEKTYAYQHKSEVGKVNAGVGFVGWVRAGVVLPQILSAPYGGSRKLVAHLRLINLDEPPEISQGFHSEKAAPLAGYSLPFDFQMEGVGYREALALKDEARALCIKIGVYVAMADGDLHEHEGQALQMWIKRMLEGSNSDTRDALKDRLNTALKDGYQEAKNGTLVLSELTERLAAIADVSMKYELVENCYDIAMRSGSNNTQVVDRIAKVLSLDLAEIEKIRDIKLVNQRRSDQPINIEELLGIDPSWDKATINRHLRNEFQKWNNRITSLAEGEEREMAQRMLNAISEARKNYG